MLRFIYHGLLLLFVVSGGARVAAGADKRVALVIGNSAYVHATALPNPKNDAADMAGALTRLGFGVIEGYDVTKAELDHLIAAFANELEGAQVGLFFYAGHGLQVDGQNYLVPVDAKLENAWSLDFETVEADLVHKTMERAAKTNLIFLDACRDNPLSRNLARALGTRSASIGRGLAAVESGEGTLISFSTQPGNVAADGTGRNSPYASALVNQLSAPRDDLSTILIEVRNQVIRETAHRQVPWEHSALTSRFYFVAPVAEPTAAPKATAPLGPSYEQQVELAFWGAVKDSPNLTIVQTYLARFPNGTFADQTRRRIGELQAAVAQTEVELKTAEEVRREEERAEAERRQHAQSLSAGPGAGQPRENVASLPVEPPKSTLTAANREPLIRALQSELKRVGCDPGPIDGAWRPEARDALGAFAKQTKTALAVEEPSLAALEAVIAQKGRICPLTCGPDQIELSGRCAARTSDGQKPVPQGRLKVGGANPNRGCVQYFNNCQKDPTHRHCEEHLADCRSTGIWTDRYGGQHRTR
jgi:hypothetical protein